MRWFIAIGLVAAGIVVGSVVGGLVRRGLNRPGASDARRQLADPAGSVALSIILAISLLAALGVADPESLNELPKGLISFMPKGLIAGLMMLFGSAIATLAASAAGSALIKATGSPQRHITRLVKSVLMGAFTILAVSQLGVNTRIVDMVSGGIIFSVALAAALLAGLGGRNTAAEVAAGRYLRRIVQPGDHVSSSSASGVVGRLHGVTVELEADAADPSNANSPADDGMVTIVHVPNSVLLQERLTIRRKRN